MSKAKTPQVKETKEPSKTPTTMADLLKGEKYNIPNYSLGEMIEGTLSSIQPKEVLLNIGGKANAVVGHKELEELSDLFKDYKVGDKVFGRIISEENREGRVVVSLKRFAFDHRWKGLTQAYKDSEKITVMVRDVVNGGILIDYKTIKGYIPPSHIDPEFQENPASLRGREMEVKILELDREQNRFVVSQMLVTRKEEIAAKRKVLKAIKAGDVLDAIVEGVVPFGLFVRINPKSKKDEVILEGLVHISEIAWEKVEDPADYFSEGDDVKVKVLEKDEREAKLNLSIKQTTEDPWVKIAKKLKKGDMVKGVVTRETAYGVFIELEKGIEGLAHISNIPSGQEPDVGDKVTVQVDTIDPSERRIALSVIPTSKPVMYR